MEYENEKFTKALIRTLVDARKRRGLSHDAIANKAGLSRQTLGKIESGIANPTMLTMYKIVRAMDMTMEQFVKAMDDYRN